MIDLHNKGIYIFNICYLFVNYNYVNLQEICCYFRTCDVCIPTWYTYMYGEVYYLLIFCRHLWLGEVVLQYDSPVSEVCSTWYLDNDWYSIYKY